MAVERSVWTLRRINSEMRRQFTWSLANVHNRASIHFGREMIFEVRELSAIVSRHYLDNKPVTLERFRLAIDTVSMLAHVNNETDVPVYVRLYLNKLVPSFLRQKGLLKAVREAFASKDPYKRVLFLYGIGAIELESRLFPAQKKVRADRHQPNLPMFLFRRPPEGLFYPTDQPLVYKFKIVGGKKIGYMGPNDVAGEIS